MVSSYTTNKNLEKPGNGDYVDTWNIPVNSDMDVIDAAFGGTTSLNATGGSANLTSTQYQKLALNITGAMSANVTYTIPSGIGGTWVVRNATTDSSGGPWAITIASGGGGSNVVVLRGKTTLLWSDGTNVRNVEENIPSIGTVTSVDVSGGTTGLTTSGGPVTTNGTITIAGILNVANGGTGANTSTGTGSVVLQNAPTITGNAVFSGANVNFSGNTVTMSGSGAIKLPTGTTAERPTPATGMLRFNANTTAFEGYNGTNWGTVGGGATGAGGDQIFYLNGQTVTATYSIPSGQNAMSTGPITINSNVTVTVPSGSKWVVL